MTEWTTVVSKKKKIDINQKKQPRKYKKIVVKECFISKSFKPIDYNEENIHDIKPVNIDNNSILDHIIKNINTHHL